MCCFLSLILDNHTINIDLKQHYKQNLKSIGLNLKVVYKYKIQKHIFCNYYTFFSILKVLVFRLCYIL